MDPSGRNLVKATETRDLIRDLQTDRNNGMKAQFSLTSTI